MSENPEKNDERPAGADPADAPGTDPAGDPGADPASPAAGCEPGSGEARPEPAAGDPGASAGPADTPKAAPASGDGVPSTDAAPTLVLPPTGTPAHADACEDAAIAAQDMVERAQAMETLLIPASTTAALTEATRSGGTQRMPAGLRAAAEAAQAEAAGADGTPRDGAAPAARRVRRRALVLVAAAVLVAVAAAVAWFALGAASQPDAGAVRQVIEADADIMDGFAADDYVEDSPYGLSDVRITSVQRQEDGSLLVDATAGLANESFDSDPAVTLLFVRAQERDRYPGLASAVEASGWAGAVIRADATTRATAGVTRDPDFPDGFSASFDAASQTCTYTAERTFDLWFGATTVSTPYTYTFDGSSWVRAAGDATSSFSWDASALEGSYAAGDGTGQISSFTISNVDPAAGTFTVEYRAAPGGWGASEVTGVLSCTLAQGKPDEGTRSFRQADGRVYTFTGEGTSSGGAGTASVSGALGLDGTVYVDLSADYTRQPFLIGEATDETLEVSGALARA